MDRVVIALLCLSPTLVVRAGEIRGVRLSDQVLVLQQGPWNDMMTVLDAGPGLVVIDTWSRPALASEGRAIAERTFGKKVTVVVNTHHHWDHVFGNQAFGDALIVGRDGVPAAMRLEYGSAVALRAAMEGIGSIDPSEKGRAYTRAVAEEATASLKLTPPTRLVNQEEELRVGALTLLLLPTPGIHSPTYMLVHVPELGLLVAPKEVGLDRPPKPESGADPRRVVAVLEKVRGSGAPLRWALLGHFDPIEKPDLEAALRAWRRLGTNG